MKYALELRNVDKFYRKHQVLKNVTLKIKPGEFYSFFGANGAGKSTLLGIVSTLVSKTSGSIKVFGLDLDKEPINVKKILGLVPQEFNFNPFEKVFQILMNQSGYHGICRRLALRRTEKRLKQVGLWNRRDQTAGLLSGGMKRRLMIARSLVHNPKLLILDEPTSGIDWKTRPKIWEMWKNLSDRGTTVLLSTHSMDETDALGCRVGFLKNGRLIPHSKASSSCSVLHETFVLNIVGERQSVSRIDKYPVRSLNAHTLEVEIPHALGFNDLFVQLNRHNIRVLDIRRRKNRRTSVTHRTATGPHA